MTIHYDSPAGVAPPVSNYSHVAVVPAGPVTFLYLAGQVGLGPDGQLAGNGDFTAQAEQTFANIAAILAAHGATMRDIVKVTFYYANMDDRAALAAVRDRYFPTPGPPSTAIEVSRLALGAWLLEVDVVAVVVTA